MMIGRIANNIEHCPVDTCMAQKSVKYMYIDTRLQNTKLEFEQENQVLTNQTLQDVCNLSGRHI